MNDIDSTPSPAAKPADSVFQYTRKEKVRNTVLAAAVIALIPIAGWLFNYGDPKAYRWLVYGAAIIMFGLLALLAFFVKHDEAYQLTGESLIWRRNGRIKERVRWKDVCGVESMFGFALLRHNAGPMRLPISRSKRKKLQAMIEQRIDRLDK